MVLGQGQKAPEGEGFLEPGPSREGRGLPRSYSLMLANKYRLTGQKNFDRVLSSGKMLQMESFGLAYLKSEEDKESRYGFVVSTKVSKQAVQRNRIKRALSEAVRFLTTDIKAGYDVIFLAKKQAIKMPTDKIMREVRTALDKTGLIK
jgi:ribonuclease P protein component